MIGFDALFPDVAAQETRSMTILEDGPVPADEYLFQEFYCVEKGCDCRRVIFSVFAGKAGKVVATINHALDKKALMYDESGETCLEPFVPQTPYSAALMDLFRNVVLQPEYASRLKRHYRMVRAAVEDPDHPIQQTIAMAADPPAARRQTVPIDDTSPGRRSKVKVGRNDPCPCGSGKKFKKCCLEKSSTPPPEPDIAPRPTLVWQVEVQLPPPKVPKHGTPELHPKVPNDLRRRLEQARLETLVLLRSLDRLAVSPAEDEFPPELGVLFELDADCAEALWVLDQPIGKFSVGKMLKDTLASLDRLPAARSAVLVGLDREDLVAIKEIAQRVAQTVRPEECYSQVKGRDPAAGK